MIPRGVAPVSLLMGVRRIGRTVEGFYGERLNRRTKQMRRLSGFFACSLLALAVLTASCTEEKPQVTLMIGGAPAELDYWEEIVREFGETSGVQVSLMRQPTDTDQRRQSLIVPLKADERDPDVFLMDIIWIGQFAASGWLEPLDTYMVEDSFDLSPFFPGMIDFADKYVGQVVALPVYVDAGLLYYRTDLIEKYGYDGPPETWRDLVDMAGTVQEGERAANPDFWGFVWQGAQYEGLVCDFLEFAVSNGGGLVDRAGNLTLDRPENIGALQFMRDLITTYRISPPNTYTEMKEEEVRTFFEGGSALFERNWPYAWGLHESGGSRVKGKVGISLLPRAEMGRHVAALGGWHAGISRSSDNKKASWELVKFIIARDTQLGFALNLGWNPARQDVYDAQELLRRAPHLVTLKGVFTTASARPSVPYYSLLSRVLQAKVNAALSGITTPEAALRQAQSEARAVVETYKQ
jgi:multiple sugar transport system substrate-binding protein